MAQEAGTEVRVWWADLTAADLTLGQGLPAAERARVEQPTSPADRGRRLVAAALLQHAVTSARGPAPEGGWPVDRTCEGCGAQHGRPVVAGGPHVSVAHAGTVIVVATCADVPVGVDVERVDRFPDDEDPASAARTWTAREAQVKAGGPGTTVQLEPPLPGYAATLVVRTGSPVRVVAQRVG